VAVLTNYATDESRGMCQRAGASSSCFIRRQLSQVPQRPSGSSSWRCSYRTCQRQRPLSA